MLTDKQLDKIGDTFYKILMKLSKEAGVEMCLVWGCKNGTETAESFARTKNLEWADCCKILVGGTSYIAESFTDDREIRNID